jgi:hypothetical protein
LFQLTHRSEVSDAVGTALGIDFTKKRMTLAEIKGLIAASKNPTVPVRKRGRAGKAKALPAEIASQMD